MYLSLQNPWEKAFCELPKFTKGLSNVPFSFSLSWKFLNLNESFPVAQMVKNLPAIQGTQETWVPFLGWENSLEEEMATHPSILAWKIPWQRSLCCRSDVPSSFIFFKMWCRLEDSYVSVFYCLFIEMIQWGKQSGFGLYITLKYEIIF